MASFKHYLRCSVMVSVLLHGVGTKPHVPSGRGHPASFCLRILGAMETEARKFCYSNRNFEFSRASGGPRSNAFRVEKRSCGESEGRRFAGWGVGSPVTEIPGRRGIFPCRNPVLPPHHDLGMKSPRRARRNPKPSISERCRRGLRKHSAARRSRVNTKKFESAETKAITSSKPLLRIPSGKALQFSQPLHLYCARRSFISGGPQLRREVTSLCVRFAS